jgi:FtsP/CotA-like multicopper oxidase with cupredoxin domain
VDYRLSDTPGVTYQASSAVPRVELFASPDHHESLDPAADHYLSVLLTGLSKQLDYALDLVKHHLEGTSDMPFGGVDATARFPVGGRDWTAAHPFLVGQGQRVRLEFVNKTTMWHPMHLHGHTYQLSGGGPRKDTVIVPPNQTVVADFDADNPGQWVMHCHNIYHEASGMMGLVAYSA